MAAGRDAHKKIAALACEFIKTENHDSQRFTEQCVRYIYVTMPQGAQLGRHRVVFEHTPSQADRVSAPWRQAGPKWPGTPCPWPTAQARPKCPTAFWKRDARRISAKHTCSTEATAKLRLSTRTLLSFMLLACLDDHDRPDGMWWMRIMHAPCL